MYIKVGTDNRIREVIVQEGLVQEVYEGSLEVTLPSNFYQYEINDWKYIDGSFVLEELPKEESMSEIEKLKQEIAELKALVSA